MTLYLPCADAAAGEPGADAADGSDSTAYDLRYEPEQLLLCTHCETVTRRQTLREVLEIGVAGGSPSSPSSVRCGAVSVSRGGETRHPAHGGSGAGAVSG